MSVFYSAVQQKLLFWSRRSRFLADFWSYNVLIESDQLFIDYSDILVRRGFHEFIRHTDEHWSIALAMISGAVVTLLWTPGMSIGVPASTLTWLWVFPMINRKYWSVIAAEVTWLHCAPKFNIDAIMLRSWVAVLKYWPATPAERCRRTPTRSVQSHVVSSSIRPHGTVTSDPAMPTTSGKAPEDKNTYTLKTLQ